MKRGSKFSVLVIAAALLSPALAHGADLIEADESFAMPNDAAIGLHGVVFTDQETGQVSSYLLDRQIQRDPLIDPSCDSLEDAKCTSSTLSFDAVLPVCKDLIDVNCLEEVGAVRPDGSRVV